MSATTNKLKYIKATDSKYADLGEEIRDLHSQSNDSASKISNVEGQISDIEKQVQDVINSSTTSNEAVVEELKAARGSSSTLNERLTNMELFKATQVLERLSVDRTYEYDSNGDITREIVRGQLNYDVSYTYLNGNVIKEEYYDIDNKLLGTKEYEYDSYNNVKTSRSTNAEVLAIVTNSYITNDLSNRLAKIEAIDFVQVGKVLNGPMAELLVSTMQDLVARVANLEYMLPGNIANIADLPYIMDKLHELEFRVNDIEIYEFEIDASVDTYYLPDEVTDKAHVTLDGLDLTNGEDYIITKGKIQFLIPLIDELAITVKY